ncbi:hypothetical protein FRX31_020883 [Thalictrum thalictroides]|uniref:Uncharacterized protein n=1 Tax=Thalictrum thalictroides TaxID=46969 RepID=A0A7J6VZL1_THATH|nr:hypothetical protein FRX31_020883 [Thalictrum thalictroides]
MLPYSEGGVENGSRSVLEFEKYFNCAKKISNCGKRKLEENREEETADHLLLSCKSIMAVWRNLTGGCDEAAQVIQEQQNVMVVLKQWPKLQVTELGAYLWKMLP